MHDLLMLGHGPASRGYHCFLIFSGHGVIESLGVLCDENNKSVIWISADSWRLRITAVIVDDVLVSVDYCVQLCKRRSIQGVKSAIARSHEVLL